MVSFANILFAELLRTGLSQKQLADKSGVKPQLISRYLSNQAVPAFDTAIKILSSLGYDFTQLNNDLFSNYIQILSPEYTLLKEDDGTITISYTDILNYKFHMNENDLEKLLSAAIAYANSETEHIKHAAIIHFINHQLTHLKPSNSYEQWEVIANYLGFSDVDLGNTEFNKAFGELVTKTINGEEPPENIKKALTVILSAPSKIAIGQ